MLSAWLSECFGLDGHATDEQVAARMRELAGLRGPTTDPALWVRLLRHIDEQLTGPWQRQESDLGALAFTSAEWAISSRRDVRGAEPWRRELVGERPIPDADVLLGWIAGTITDVLAPFLISSGRTRLRLYQDPRPEHPNRELAEAIAGYVPVGEPVDDQRCPGVIVGDLLDARVVRIASDEVLVDVGLAVEAVIPQNELTVSWWVDPSHEVELHQQVEVRVMEKQDDERFLKVSRQQAHLERAWPVLSATFDARGDVDGQVVGTGSGGLRVDVGARGFLPERCIIGFDDSDLADCLGVTVRCTISDMRWPNVTLANPRFIRRSRPFR